MGRSMPIPIPEFTWGTRDLPPHVSIDMFPFVVLEGAPLGYLDLVLTGSPDENGRPVFRSCRYRLPLAHPSSLLRRLGGVAFD